MARPRATDAAGTDTRELILVAAMRQIAAHGTGAVRLSGVAREAGVSLGLAQHYFGTRDGLLRAAFAAGSDAELARADAIASGPGSAAERLVALVAYLCSEGDPREGSWLFWLELSLAAAREPGLGLPTDLSDEAWHDLLARVLAEGARDGTVATARAPERLAADLLALVYGVMVRQGHGRGDPRALADRILAALDLDTPPAARH